MRLLSLLIMISLSIPGWGQATPRCGTDAWRAQYPPSAPTEETEAAAVDFREVIIIPVVIHVVYKNGAENISEEQILSQLEVLNDDFRGNNLNQIIIPLNFATVFADTDIEFCLASRTPTGAYTTGITRTETNLDNIGTTAAVHYTTLGGKDGWNPEFYLNIWIADMGSNLGGRATFPGSGPAAEDGVVIHPSVFGTVGTALDSEPYDLGRTTVHEIGHYLNLEHVWGEGDPSCGGNDFVSDTPVSSNWYLGECPEILPFSCGSADMYTNYMFYTNDACMAQFTIGQRNRMRACLNGPRAGLKSSDGCSPSSTTQTTEPAFSVTLGPQPAPGYVVLSLPENSSGTFTLSLFDLNGRTVRATQMSAGQLQTWDLSGLPNGMYILKIQQGRQSQLRKLVLQY